MAEMSWAQCVAIGKTERLKRLIVDKLSAMRDEPVGLSPAAIEAMTLTLIGDDTDG